MTSSNGVNSSAFLKQIFNHSLARRRRFTPGAAAVAAFQHARLEPSTALPATRPDAERDLYAESAKVTKQFTVYTDKAGNGSIQMAYNPTAQIIDSVTDNDPFELTEDQKVLEAVHPPVCYTGVSHRDVTAVSFQPFQPFAGVGEALAAGVINTLAPTSGGWHKRHVNKTTGIQLTSSIGSDNTTTDVAGKLSFTTNKSEFVHRELLYFEKSPVKAKDVWPVNLMASTTSEAAREKFRNTARKVHRLTGQELRITYSGPEEFRNGTIWVVQPERNESITHLTTINDIRNHPTARSHSINSMGTLRILMQRRTNNANKYHSQSSGLAVHGSNTYSWEDAAAPNVGIYIEMPSLGCYKGDNGPLGLPFECEVSCIFEYAPIILDKGAPARLTHTDEKLMDMEDGYVSSIAQTSEVTAARKASVALAAKETIKQSLPATAKRKRASSTPAMVKRAKNNAGRSFARAQPTKFGSYTRRQSKRSYRTLYRAAPTYKRKKLKRAASTRKRSRSTAVSRRRSKRSRR